MVTVVLICDVFWIDQPFPPPLFTDTEQFFYRRGEDCAKNKDQSRSGKTIQEDRERKDQGKKGICTPYPDEEIGQQKEGFEKTQTDCKRGCKRDQGVDPLSLNVNLNCHQRSTQNAKGKRWAKDEAEKEEGS